MNSAAGNAAARVVATCATCRFASENVSSDGEVRCTRIQPNLDLEYASTEVATVIDYMGDDDTCLVVRPSFGCVLHEVKL
jgi:hypothetical protein